jgi:glycosyltransferase involved in cell wall biosynthesis
MNSDKPLFTVIIPTKDRALYLKDTIRTCINQNYNNLEIIISDDASSDNTKEVVEFYSKVDSRVKYIRRDIPLGMRLNFEKTLELVKPGFVLALGGDDGLMPNAIEDMHSLLIRTKQKLLTWSPPTYVYPDSSNSMGQLMMSLKKFNSLFDYEIIKTERFLKRQANNLAYASDIECPMFYVKGVVSTDLIRNIINKTPGNVFYACPTPDGYSGIVLAGEVETFVFSKKPLSIFGLSKNSQGKNYLSKDESAKALSESFYDSVSDITMHAKLASQPYSPLITLMSADYLLKSKDIHKENSSYPELDFKNVISKSIDELMHGLYASDRLLRELKILYKIAELHNLQVYFEYLLRSKRRFIDKKPLSGNAFSFNTLFVEAKTLGINNIFDASYMAYFHYKSLNQVSFSFIFKALINSLKYRFVSRKKGEKFPFIDQLFNSDIN